jgi:phospholipase/carboxylesterase
MAVDELLPAIEVETAGNPRFSVIWLHGLGADGSDFEPVVPELRLPDDCATRFIFPHAPAMPVTCNGGYVMPSWYDIISLDTNNREIDEAGIVRSRAQIARLIERENRRGIPSRRIFIAGFSQGGAVAYTTALTYPQKLAGVIALSTYIPSPLLVTGEASQENRAIPVFAAHGLFDDVVSIELGRMAKSLLESTGYAVTWREYPMPHSVDFAEIGDIGRWLASRMAEIDVE